jgi:hypothetical protein
MLYRVKYKILMTYLIVQERSYGRQTVVNHDQHFHMHMPKVT